MINHTRKLLCLHIEKCGGTSLDKVMREECNFPRKPYSRIHWTLSQHVEFWQQNGEDILNDYFKFCVVRNPWDRLVSQYFYYGGEDCEKKFQDWVLCKSYYTNNRYSYFPMVRHTSFKDKLNCMDFIIRQENFQGDFDILCDKIGISRVALPHKNKTNHKPYCEYYDEETKELIGELYSDDIEVFGYEFRE